MIGRTTGGSGSSSQPCMKCPILPWGFAATFLALAFALFVSLSDSRLCPWVQEALDGSSCTVWHCDLRSRIVSIGGLCLDPLGTSVVGGLRAGALIKCLTQGRSSPVCGERRSVG